MHMNKPISLILAALMLSSAMSVNIFAEEETPVENPPEVTVPETPEEPDTETPEPETPEVETPEPETTPPETFKPDQPPEPEVEVEEKDLTYTITIAGDLLEKGMVVPSRRTAKEGDVIILTAYEREFTKKDKSYREEFRRWYSNVDIFPIALNRNTAFFYMPAEDVVIYPIFETVDVTEYYDWDSVRADVKKLRRGESLEVDMADESEIPKAVLKELAGKDADVMFTTENCIYTLNGNRIDIDKDSSGGYSLRFEDYELSSVQKWLVKNSDIVSIRVEVESDHDVTANLRCFASKNLQNGYFYKINRFDVEFISAINIRNGEAILPVTESGTYIVTATALAGVDMAIGVDSVNTVPIVGGKLEPVSAVADGKLYFRAEEPGRLTYSEYTNSYADVKSHKYKSQIDFVSARHLIDGATDTAFLPNAGITTGEFMRAIARLRGIPDKDAYDYCTQLDIFTYEYVEDALLTRNEMSVIFTNFINHLIDYPKSFGGYSMAGFDGNAAAWVGNRFRELKNNSSGEYDWKEYATRAEAAYLLEAAVRTVVTGE